MAVAVPFARGHVPRLQLADFARETSTRLVRGELAAVEPGTARTTDGMALPFDALLVAVGAGASRPSRARRRGRSRGALLAAHQRFRVTAER